MKNRNGWPVSDKTIIETPTRLLRLPIEWQLGPLNATRYVWEPKFHNETGKITDIADIISNKVTPSSESNSTLKFALIRMDELPNNPVKIEKFIYCAGSEIEGSLKIVLPGDVLLARLGPSMLNQKILVVPKISASVSQIIASPEFIVIRPKKPEDSFYISGVLRTKLMLKYMYSKTRGGTPSRYRLIEQDLINMKFPKLDEVLRFEHGERFKKSLVHHDKVIRAAYKKLTAEHDNIEADF